MGSPFFCVSFTLPRSVHHHPRTILRCGSIELKYLKSTPIVMHRSSTSCLKTVPSARYQAHFQTRSSASEKDNDDIGVSLKKRPMLHLSRVAIRRAVRLGSLVGNKRSVFDCDDGQAERKLLEEALITTKKKNQRNRIIQEIENLSIGSSSSASLVKDVPIEKEWELPGGKNFTDQNEEETPVAVESFSSDNKKIITLDEEDKYSSTSKFVEVVNSVKNLSSHSPLSNPLALKIPFHKYLEIPTPPNTENSNIEKTRITTSTTSNTSDEPTSDQRMDHRQQSITDSRVEDNDDNDDDDFDWFSETLESERHHNKSLEADGLKDKLSNGLVSINPLDMSQWHLTANPITDLKLHAANMTPYEQDLKGLSTFFPGIERQKRKEEMMKCTLNLQELIQAGKASIENINLLIKAKSLQGNLDEALKIYDEATCLGFEANANTFVALIQGTVPRKDPAAARMMYLKMRSRLITPTPRVYGSLIHAHVASGEIAAGFALKRKMEDEGIEPDLIIYTTLINGLIERGHHELAWNLFYDMRTWKLIEPDEVLFTVMIKSCALKEETEKALCLLDDLRLSGLQPTDITYTELMHACCKNADFFEKTFEFLNQMKAEDMPITLDVYQYLLEACSQLGHIGRTKEILWEMRSNKIKLNEVHCIKLILTLATSIKTCKKGQTINKSRHVQQTWSVINYLRATSPEIQVSTELLNAVMCVYINGQFHQFAIDMLHQYETFKCEPDAQTYLKLLEMFCFQLKDVGRFFSLWNFITRETDIELTPSMLYLAVEAALLSGSASQTLDILQMMYRLKVFPTHRLTAKLSRVGKDIPELTQLMSNFVKLESKINKMKTYKERENTNLNIEEHQLRKYVIGETEKTLGPENLVRKEYFDKKKEKEGKYTLPQGLYRQLKKKGGDYYSKIHDRQSPKIVVPGPGLTTGSL